ncbi:MAG: hypothetical protein II480_13765 [Bacteroidales bacterium]|nr:hypothetical protein [Bacteroidales bacterium]
MHRKLQNIIIAILTAVTMIAAGGGVAAQEADSVQFDKLISQCNELIATEPYSAVEYAAMARQIAEASGDSVNIATAYSTPADRRSLSSFMRRVRSLKTSA